ncbi:MAG: sodium:proton antiporter NhaD [Parachlamydiales bacterium]|nr:sodium:proton antiporter NhaD [Parachlamydiales bacterium]
MTYEYPLIIMFIIGYLAITIEHSIKINKAAIALFTAVVCWAIYFLSHQHAMSGQMTTLQHYISEISQIVFFLIGAMTIVETVDSHGGFTIVTDLMKTRSKRSLLWIIGFVTFFLSAILDNLTTTIVMVSLLRKLIPDANERKVLGAMVVISANAGGAWTPIGDVTTTMLWINGQISTLNIMKALFLPSLACLIIPLLWETKNLKGKYPKLTASQKTIVEPKGTLIFFLGLAALVAVPIIKVLTGLPPFMGMFIGLAILWIVTDFLHVKDDKRNHLRVPHILTKIDISGALFFFGILLAIKSLEISGLLNQIATWLNQNLPSLDIVALVIGLISAVIDNVPLVAATQGMYSLADHPMDSRLWELIAYCAGTGGSILIIGSAAGVALMGLEKIHFAWYFKRISFVALLGYLAGFGVYYFVN